MVRTSEALLLALLTFTTPAAAQRTAPCPVARAAAVVVYGDVARELTLTRADLAQLPRVTVTGQPHGGAEAEYSGVFLGEIMARAGLPTGADLRGAEMVRYVVIEAADGYRALFALAELDSRFREEVPILADQKDGKPLDAEVGPFQIIAPTEMRHARWVRQVQCIRVSRDVTKT